MRSSSVRSGVSGAGGEQVDRPHLLHSQRAPGSLVGQRGVHEPVEQHDRAAPQQRLEPLVHELGPRGRVQQRLGARRDRQRRVFDERANALGHGHAAGLPQELHLAAARRDRPGEGLGERGLAGAVESLDRDQPAASHSGTVPSPTMASVTPPDSSAAAPADPAAARSARAAAASPAGAGEALPGIDAHPHARAVLAGGLPPQGDPSHAYLFHGPAGTGKRAVARAFAAALLADGAQDPGQVAERVARGSHPDLTWVTPSGAAEMLVADIEEPVVAAATRTPFESSRRVFVIEAVDTMNDQAANRMLKTLEEPAGFVHLLLLTDRREDVMATIASRCQHVRFDPLPPARMAEGLQLSDADRASACAALALGDADLAARLAGEEGAALRGAAEDLVRSALAGTTQERPWTGLLQMARDAGTAAAEEAQERMASELELLAEQGAQTLRTRKPRRPAPRRAARAHAHAGSRAEAGGAVAARHAVHLRGSPRADLRG